jgi:predicted Zn-dependent protease
MKKYILLLLVLAAGVMSCTSQVASTTGALAKIAGSTGLIDKDVADAIARSSDVVGQATAEISPSEEYYIGRAVGANILQTYKLYTNPALTTYVNKVLDTLAINSDQPEIYNGYHAAILDSTEINGFSTSGGHIFITRGLLACATTEDALASVLAHELAHVQLQHSIKSIKNSRMTGALQSIAGEAAKVMGINELSDIFGESVSEAVNTMLVNGYSQTQEFDADRMAIYLLANAGYTPSSILEMLDALKKNSTGQQGGFSKTHPSPDARIANANKNVGLYQVKDTRSFRLNRFNGIKK